MPFHSTLKRLQPGTKDERVRFGLKQPLCQRLGEILAPNGICNVLVFRKGYRI